MKVLVSIIGAALVIKILPKLVRIVVSDIKADPVTNLIVPATTALLTSLLLCLLETLRQ